VSALIVVDLAQVHPEFDGRWHRVLLKRMPAPGESVTTLCGRTEPVVYGTSADRRAVRLTCWECDRRFRTARGLPVWSAEHLPVGVDEVGK